MTVETVEAAEGGVWRRLMEHSNSPFLHLCHPAGAGGGGGGGSGRVGGVKVVPGH
jgi:hypothetical protein